MKNIAQTALLHHIGALIVALALIYSIDSLIVEHMPPLYDAVFYVDLASGGPAHWLTSDSLTAPYIFFVVYVQRKKIQLMPCSKLSLRPCQNVFYLA